MNTNEIVDHWIKILQAWNTQEVQYRVVPNGKWHDDQKQYPPEFDKYEYRIKPEIKTYRPVVLLNCKNEPYILAINDFENAIRITQNSNFVKWASENWIEYEI